ncbi:MAG: sigma-54-dependent Fis family transcriptional regulator, partial [Deltaproteobacteria bacterium]|nr:sigma-54-dependent Fis family transcriptional regulator [Deltaproteobacteria bacterium]
MSDSIQALTATLSQPRDQEKLERRPTGLTLEVVSGDLEGARYSLPNRSVLTGGRAASHDIVIDDESVSTTHFEIKLGAHGIVLRDLGSTNGTWIGRSRLLDGAVSLFDGATFYAGNIKLRLTQIDVGSVARSTAPTLGTMTGKSPVMAELFALMARLGPTPITALITGETGTGKEEAARTLHALSGRQGPFVVLDCGSLPTGLAESAISGHAKGAFTGAASDSPGAFEKGQAGTLV